MYRAVCLDLDGTLLTDEKELTETTKIVLQKLMERGIEIFIATGRQFDKARAFLEPLEGDLTFVCNNGALARGSLSMVTLHRAYLDPLSYGKILKLGLEYELFPAVYVDYYEEGFDLVIADHDRKENHQGTITHPDRIRFFSKLDDPSGRVLSMVYIAPRVSLECLQSRVKESDIAVATHIIALPRSSLHMLEFMKPKTNKWNSLCQLARSKGISPEEMVAFGDEANDLMMLEEAGLGIAMKNAHPEVKIRADRVSLYDNNHDGVARELIRIFSMGDFNG